MQAERERVNNLRINYIQEQGKDWKKKWAEKVISEMEGKPFYLKIVDAEEVSGFFAPNENEAVTQMRNRFLEEIQGFIFNFKMDKKESFHELEELFKILQTYQLIQVQVDPMVNSLQKVADKFFYIQPYLSRLEKLYTEASTEDKEKYDSFYNDVKSFWKNARQQSLNFSRIIQEELSKETMDYPAIFVLVSKMYTTNQYYLASKLVKGAVDRLEETNNTDHYLYQGFLLNLSSLYMLQEDYEKTLEVQLKQEKLGLLNSETTVILSYLQLKNYDKALEMSEEYLKKTAQSDPYYLGIMNTKVSCLFAMEKYNEAYDASMELIKISNDQNKDVNSGSYFTLSEICKHNEDLEQAEQYIKKAYQYSKKEIDNLPDLSGSDVTSLLNIRLYKFYYYMKYVGLLIDIDRKEDIDLENVFQEYDYFEYLIRNIMLNPSKFDRKQVIQLSEECGDIIYLLAQNMDEDATKELAYNFTLLSKEIDLSSVIAIRKYAVDSKNKDYKTLFEKWMKVRKQILFHEEGIDIDSLKDISYGLHKELAIKTRKEVFSEMEKNNVEWEQVKTALRPNELAVEYVFYAPDNYAALLLRKEMSTPVILPLCKEGELKPLLEPETRLNEQGVIDFIYNQNGPQILAKIIDPLRPYLSDVKTIYYSPSGILHGISLEALSTSTESNAKRLGKEFRLKRVGKTSLLARKSKLSPRKATIFGGMNYSALQEATSEDSDRGLKVKDKKNNNNKAQSAEEMIAIGGGFNYLKGTLREVDMINEELTSSKVEVDLYTGNNATEDQFLEYCKTPTDILHIATHAYFSPYVKKENIKEGSYKGAAKIFSDPDPMNRAGIVFSGANYFWETGKNYEKKSDGILMASELSNYDLRKTSLAIISACQSGIGQSTRSEGVYGFQRAFKLAGIDNQIISLWTVDDAATQKFMTLFYKYYIEFSDISLAVAKAKEDLQQEYEHPYYWAAFVHVQ
ncbi:hypothetical protein AVL50_05830 [Flammeovirga sp. SJP92]|nr:hypothetical protein AVL50_05830 [Flammeovirga sp. SJP92]